MKLKTMTISSISAMTVFFMLSSSAFAANHTVTIKGFSFSPANLSVTAGDTVTFKNADQAPHTATAKDGSFDTQTIEAGGSKNITITKAGSFKYFCGVHPHMTGEILAQKLATLEEPTVDKKTTQLSDETLNNETEVNIDEAKASTDAATARQIETAKRIIDKEAADKIATANLEAYKAAATERATAKIAAYREKMERETYARIKSYNGALHTADQNTPSCNKSSNNTISSSDDYSY